MARMDAITSTIGSTEILNTYAEAFRVAAARIVVTAADEYWVRMAAQSACGYGTSVIGCDAEVGVERWLTNEKTPDGRPGVSLLFFAFASDKLASAVANRVGQCVLTCATTAAFNGLSAGEQVFPLGKYLRYFGDGFQSSETLAERTLWKIPVMDGVFVVEENAGWSYGVGGGNFLILAESQPSGLAAARVAVEAIAACPDVATPFPGGVVRSGSKVGSRYKNVKASTAHEYCPSLRDQVSSKLPTGVNCVYEIVINGLSVESVTAAMAAGIRAACCPGVVAIGAGNYGGRLGKYQIHLRDALASADRRSSFPSDVLQ